MYVTLKPSFLYFIFYNNLVLILIRVEALEHAIHEDVGKYSDYSE